MSLASPRRDEVARILGLPDDEKVTRRLHGPVRRIVGSVLRATDPHLFDTAVHDALLDVVRGRHRFAGRSRGSTWLYTVARRAALRCVRRERARLPLVSFEEPGVRHAAEAAVVVHADPCARREAERRLRRAVPNAEHRRIWRLYHDPEHRRSHAEVARLTGYTRGSVEVILSRVRQALKRPQGR